MLPESHAWRFHSDDLDDARAFVRRNFGDHSRVVLAAGPLGFDFCGLAGRGAVAARVSARLPNVVRAAVTMPTLHAPLRGTYTYRIGRRTLHAVPGSVVLLPAGHEYTLTSTPGIVAALQVDADLIARECADRATHGVSRTKAMVAAGMRMQGSSTEALRNRLLQTVSCVTCEPTGDTSDTLAAGAHEIIALLVDCLLEQRGLRPASPGRLHLAESLARWVDEHLAEPITLERLARVAGVSPRSVQRSFLLRWGQTPLQFVAARRFAAAREALRRHDSDVSVSRAALDSGLTHLGRFATLYRKIYGESPSQTTARAGSRDREGHC